MNDWAMWRNSSETKAVLKDLNEVLKEARAVVIDGHLLNHDKADKIAVDYAHKVGVVEGLEKAIEILKDEDEDERS